MGPSEPPTDGDSSASAAPAIATTLGNVEPRPEEPPRAAASTTASASEAEGHNLTIVYDSRQRTWTDLKLDRIWAVQEESDQKMTVHATYDGVLPSGNHWVPIFWQYERREHEEVAGWLPRRYAPLVHLLSHACTIWARVLLDVGWDEAIGKAVGSDETSVAKRGAVLATRLGIARELYNAQSVAKKVATSLRSRGYGPNAARPKLEDKEAAAELRLAALDQWAAEQALFGTSNAAFVDAVGTGVPKSILDPLSIGECFEYAIVGDVLMWICPQRLVRTRGIVQTHRDPLGRQTGRWRVQSRHIVHDCDVKRGSGRRESHPQR